jgi:hypothetical protein
MDPKHQAFLTDLVTLGNSILDLQPLVKIHHRRVSTLSTRVLTTTQAVSSNFATVYMRREPLMLYTTALVEIRDYFKVIASEEDVAGHLLKFGSDEELFIKFSERLQHCLVELALQLLAVNYPIF